MRYADQNAFRKRARTDGRYGVVDCGCDVARRVRAYGATVEQRNVDDAVEQPAQPQNFTAGGLQALQPPRHVAGRLEQQL
jgi:hypothetical protein